MRQVTKVSLCLVALLASTNAFADRVGFYLGSNMAKYSSDPDISSSTDANFMFGGYAEFTVSDKFSIEPGIRYVEKGADISNYSRSQNLISGGEAQVTRTARYAEIPLHFNFKFREPEQTFRPYLFVGPAIAFKFGDSTKVTSQTSSTPITFSNGLNDGLKSLDFSAEAGGGLELFFTEDVSARFSAAYSIGLLDVNETANDWRTRGFQVYAGLGFTF